MAVSIVLLLLIAVALGWPGPGRSFSRRLETHLRGCVAEGIITADQHRSVLEYVERHRRALRIRGSSWIAIFGGLFVAAGVCLIIAHNWERIGPEIRVASFVLMLAGVGEAAVRLGRRGPALALPSELVWFFFPLIGIGLYAQTFQLSGDPIRPFLLWLALILPLAWLSPHRVAGPLHLISTIAVLFSGNFSPGNMISLIRRDAPFAAWLFSFALIASAAAICRWRIPLGYRRHALGAAAAWLFILLAAPTPLEVKHAGMLALAGIALATLWTVAGLILGKGRQDREPAGLAWIGSLYAMTFFWHAQRPISGDVSGIGAAVAAFLAVAAFAAGVLLPPGLISPRPFWQRLGQAALAAGLLIALPLLSGNVAAVKASAVAANLLLAASGVAFMMHGSIAGSAAQINTGVLVISMLFVTRFIDLFGSLLQSGVGFIAAGIALSALAFLLDRGRRRLLRISREGREA